MRIITVSREFSSGGRELGKRLADILGYDYYDRQIISAIAEKQGLDENYVESVLSDHGWRNIPITFHSTFAIPQMTQVNLLLEQTKVIEEIAKKGKDCIIVGRNADVLLRDYEPFKLFVCADMDSKIQRCIERRSENEKLSRRKLEQTIRNIDKQRANIRDILSSSEWGQRDAYNLTVNTTGWVIKELAPAVADYINKWYDRTKL